MYKIFRDNKQTLPGDDEIMKSQKPSIKIVLQPLISEKIETVLPKLEYSQLTLQPNMIIESLKKYIKKKLENKIETNIDVSISYKNIEMLDHYTIRDIERIYSFTGEKTIFYYSKKDSFIKFDENKLNKNIAEFIDNNSNNVKSSNMEDSNHLNNNQVEEEIKSLNEKEYKNNENNNQDFDNKDFNNIENEKMNIDLNC